MIVPLCVNVVLLELLLDNLMLIWPVIMNLTYLLCIILGCTRILLKHLGDLLRIVNVGLAATDWHLLFLTHDILEFNQTDW